MKIFKYLLLALTLTGNANAFQFNTAKITIEKGAKVGSVCGGNRTAYKSENNNNTSSRRIYVTGDNSSIIVNDGTITGDIVGGEYIHVSSSTKLSSGTYDVIEESNKSFEVACRSQECMMYISGYRKMLSENEIYTWRKK